MIEEQKNMNVSRPISLAALRSAPGVMDLLRCLGAMLVGQACFAQVDGDGWLVSAGGVSSYTYEMRVVSGVYQAVAFFTGPGAPNLPGAAPMSGWTRPSRDGEVYFLSRSGFNASRTVMAAQRDAQGAYSVRYVLNSSWQGMGVLEVAGSEVWSCGTASGLVHSWPTYGATQATLRGDLASIGASSGAWGAATDGRDVFFGIGDSIYAVDTLATTFSPRLVAAHVIPQVVGPLIR